MSPLLKGHHLDGLEEWRDDAATKSWINRKRATAFERAYGSAGGKNLEG
jgi:hypothetical protein